MEKRKNLRRGLIALLSLAFCLTLMFAVVSFGSTFANAASTQVTVVTDGNGTVSVNDGSPSESEAAKSVTASAEVGEKLTLKASANEGYVFAYWYETAETPLCYDTEFLYEVSAETPTVHAKFFEKTDKITTTTSEDWTTDAEAGTYTIKNSDGTYDLPSEQQYWLTIEFVGEKWFSYSYNLAITTDATYGFGQQLIYVNGQEYHTINSAKSSSAKPSSSDTIDLKAMGDGYHRIEITFQAPEYSAYVATPTKLEYTISDITLKNDSGLQYTSATVKWDARLGEAYYLPGVVNTQYTDAEFIIQNGIKLENEGGSATASVPANLPIGLAVKPFDEVTSTIDPSLQTGVQLGGIHYGPNNSYGTTGDDLILYFNEQGHAGEPGTYHDTPVEMKLQEIAVLPKVSLTKTVGGNQETLDPESGANFLLDYAIENNLLFTIEQSPAKKEVTGKEFEITVNGKPLGAKEDTGEGASDKGYTFLDGKYGFNLANLTENTVVVITPDYGEEYVKTSYTISFNISSPYSGLPDVISPASAPITIEDDSANPWFFDPAYNGEGNMYAFSSPFTEKETASYSVSQIGFKVKGTGVFQLEFYLDGPDKYSAAAYKTGSRIVPSSGNAFTSKDLGYNKGFLNGVANNLAIPQTTISWDGKITYAAPTICDSTNVKVLDGDVKWYTFTLGIEAGDEAETQIWFAHGIYNSSNSKYNRLTIRNVAYYSGAAYADWGVEGADGQIVQNNGEITVDIDKAGLLDAGKAINFTANLAPNQTFYGWKIVSGTLTNDAKVGHEGDAGFTVEDSDITWDTEHAKLVSYELNYRHVVGPGYNKVVAVIATNGSYAVRNGGKLYKPDEIQTALNDAAAGKDKNVVIVDNVTLNGIDIPADVNLIIPYDRAGNFYTMGTKTTAQTRVSWASKGIYQDPVYTLTLTGENVVNGTLTVGGVLHYPDQSAQGHTSGYYSQLILLEEGTALNVKSGGHLDVYGRVTGEGRIDVVSGGKLSQPFMITDYNGGTNTEASFNKNVTPFKMYAMVNVQNKGGFTIHHGAELYGHASLYFWESITTIEQPFISYVKESKNGMDYFQNDALIVLNFGASAHIVYDDLHARPEMGASNNAQDVGKTTIEITGNAYADFMQFPLNINTTKVYFSIPYNYEITLKSGGTFDILHPYKAMPGSVLTVESGATLNVRSGAGLHVYDSFSIPDVAKRTYPTGKQLTGAGYKSYASLIVNGTLNIQDGATFLGTVQTTDTTGEAKIVVGNGVTLKDELFDGVETEYSCNYTKYTLEAHVWDKVHKELRPLEEGRTYHSTYAKDETFTLPGITFQIESNTHGTKNEESPHVDGHVLVDSKTDEATDLTGAWKVDHAEDRFDWTLSADEKNFGDEKFKELTHVCTELGCDATETKLLLSAQEFDPVVYNGETLDSDALLAKFGQLYGLSAEQLSTYGVKLSVKDNETVKNAKAYTLTVTLEKGYYLDETTVSHEYGFTVTPFDLGTVDASAVSTDDLDGFVYNGKAQELPEIHATVTGVTGTETFSDLTWNNNTNAGSEGTVTLNGSGNFTGSVMLKFSIAKKQITVELVKQTADYSGSEPEVSSEKTYYVLNGLAEGESGDDVKVTLSFAQPYETWNKGTYDLTASVEAENYVLGSVSSGTGAFEIVAKSLAEGKIALSGQTFVYNGEAHEPFENFTLVGFEKMTMGTDFDVSYSTNGKDVGEVTVTVLGRGNFTGEATATFTITPRSITEGQESASVVVPENGFVYKGEAWTPDIEITIAGVTGAVDYKLEYASNTNAGQATVTVTGQGNFDGSFTLTFDIERATLTVVPDRKNSPMGQPQLPLTAQAQGLLAQDAAAFEAVKDTIYKLSAAVDEESEEGSYDITVEILQATWGNYTVTAGSGEGAYTVTPEVFSNVKFTAKTVTYNGKAYTFEAELNHPDAGTEGTFSATYDYHKDSAGGELVGELKNAGLYFVVAHITFTAQNGQTYSTDLSAMFTITPKSISSATVELDPAADLTYTGKAITPAVKSVTVGDLTLNANEYTVSWSENIDVGDGTVTVSASGNFMGKTNVTFRIKARSLENATISVSQKSFVYNGKDQTPAVTVTLSVGGETLTLTENDFEAVYTGNCHVGKATVTVSGKKNYSGSATLNDAFEIAAKPVNVTVNDQSAVYTGETPVLSQGSAFWRTAAGAIEGEDDLRITLSLTAHEGKWNVGEYAGAIGGTSENSDYFVTFTNGKLTVTKKAVTVDITDKSSVYGENYAELAFTVAEDALAVGDTKNDLGVTLSFDGDTNSRLGAGTYRIVGTAAGQNYDVTFRGSWELDRDGTYTVQKREVQIAIVSHSHVYDGAEPAVTQEQETDWKVTGGSIVSGDDLHIKLQKAVGTTVTENGYAITGNYENANYTVTFTEGTYTITARPVTVEIEDQEAVYHYEHNYPFDGTQWHLSDETPLAQGESKEDLHVTISVTGLEGAGKYAITGVWENGNYSVTFTGAYEKDGDALSGKAGLYTIAKRDISDDAIFMLLVDADFTSDGTSVIRTTYAGKTLTLSGNVMVEEGNTSRSLSSVLSKSTIDAEGNYEVTVEISDANYSGSASFTVIVTDAKGYTQKLKETLTRLSALAEGKDVEALKAEDFDDLKEMLGLLNALDEEERKAAAAELAQYDALVNAWNKFADAEEVIETAEKIADSPIAALFEAAAALTALAGLAYIALKGGIL